MNDCAMLLSFLGGRTSHILHLCQVLLGLRTRLVRGQHLLALPGVSYHSPACQRRMAYAPFLQETCPALEGQAGVVAVYDIFAAVVAVSEKLPDQMASAATTAASLGLQDMCCVGACSMSYGNLPLRLAKQHGLSCKANKPFYGQRPVPGW